MKKNKFIAFVCAAATATSLFATVPAFADATKVVSIGANLSEQQKDTMLRYFNVKKDNSVQRINVTNKDEVEHLSDFVPREQIGTRTVSCAYIKPTESGGIRVKTANLEYVTANMIASTLADLGIKNCEVVAACPFKVSGTGALTGIIMAYETATGETLDETKKDIATQEMVIIKDLSKDIGAEKAETVINQAKAEAVQNNIADKQEIENTINNIITENNITITNEQIQNITNLTQNIVNQDYGDDYVEIINDIMTEEPEISDEPLLEEPVDGKTDEEKEEPVQSKDSITVELDESILGGDVIVSATDKSDLNADETLNEEPEVSDEPLFEEENTPETDTPETPDVEDIITPETPENEEFDPSEEVLDGTATDDGTVTPNEEDSDEIEIPDVSKYGFNMKDVLNKEGEDAAKDFIEIENYMVEHFPAEWTEKELMTKDIKPEEKMSEIAESIMTPYYEYLMKEDAERELPLFDTFMEAVSKLMDEGKLSEEEGMEFHELAPIEKVEGEGISEDDVVEEATEEAEPKRSE